jgi:hypothetical protein
MAYSPPFDRLVRSSYGVMRKCFHDPPFLIKMEDFGYVAVAGALIVDSDAADSRHDGNQFEAQIEDKLQRFGPIGAHGILAAQDPARLPGDLDDHRGRHFKVVGVVSKNPGQVVAVPGSYPFPGEMLCESLVYR